MSRTYHHGRPRKPLWLKTPKPWVKCRTNGGSRRTKLTTPSAWIRMRMNKPKRHANKQMLRNTVDYDAVAFPLGNRKPHEYYY